MENRTKKILSPDQSIQVAQDLHRQNKRIVLAGGCFDIIHIGHVLFLQKAKEQGDILMVFVAHDDQIKKLKGRRRPINTQQDRAYLLAHLIPVDYVILLPAEIKDWGYDTLVNKLKPAIIATTAGDTDRFHKERQAKEIGAKVVDVTPSIENQSTTKLLTLLKEKKDSL